MSRRGRQKTVAAGRTGSAGRAQGGPTPARPRAELSFLVIALAAAILAAGAWAMWSSFGGVFALDDERAIVRNQTIRTLSPLSVPLSPPSESTVAGRPVANLSFAISYAIGAPAPADGGTLAPRQPAGIDPTPFHAGNIGIHLAAALALFGIVRRTLVSPRLRGRFGEAAPWIAFATALIWVVHPLQTSAVTYVVQRVESLMGLFYLLTLYCAIRAGEGTRRTWWAAAAVTSCAAGMATKETMVTAPIMVALWDWMFREPAGGRASRVRWGLAGALAAAWLLLVFVVTRQFRAPSIDLAPTTIWLYVRTQAEVLVHYVRLAVFPSPLVFLYDWPLTPAPIWRAWQAALLAGLAALTVAGIVRRHPAAFLGAWFFLILAPSSSVLPIITEVAAEHRMYLPLGAVVSAFVLGVYVAGTRLVGRWKRAALIAAAAACALLVGALGLEARGRSRVYWSAVDLWGDTVAKRPGDPRPRVAYGEALGKADRLAEAEVQLKRATELAPQDTFARTRLGSVLARQGKYEEAVVELDAALALQPGNIDAHRFLGEIHAIERRDRLALEHYSKALAAVPADALILTRMAAIRAESQDPSVRDPVRARALAERAAQLTGGRDPRILEVLAAAQAAAGSLRDAAATARAAAATARELGNSAAAASLDYRAVAYEQAASQPPAPVK
jgi:Flp pilus assembly protein TadD